VRAGLAAMGEPPESLQVPMVQFVTLWKGGEKVPMGKREAQFVTLRDLRTEVGNDAARFTYVMRSNDQPLDFDLELAKKQTNDNPVYYVQYAHARIASVLKQAAERGLPFDQAAGAGAIAATRAGATAAGRIAGSSPLGGGADGAAPTVSAWARGFMKIGATRSTAFASASIVRSGPQGP